MAAHAVLAMHTATERLAKPRTWTDPVVGQRVPPTLTILVLTPLHAIADPLAGHSGDENTNFEPNNTTINAVQNNNEPYLRL
ncbi:UNVERIFIED_CONTAM: hypothetical protein DES50_12010 [Williamsia faeni]